MLASTQETSLIKKVKTVSSFKLQKASEGKTFYLILACPPKQAQNLDMHLPHPPTHMLALDTQSTHLSACTVLLLLPFSSKKFKNLSSVCLSI
jgi:hypothetical protein